MGTLAPCPPPSPGPGENQRNLPREDTPLPTVCVSRPFQPLYPPPVVLFYFFNVYLFLRETSQAGEGQRGQREGDRGSEGGSVPTAEPEAGLELQNCEIMA